MVYAIVSLLLVIGSLSLSLAQGESAATPNLAPTALPSSTSPSGATTGPTTRATTTATAPPTATPTATLGSAPAGATSTFFYPSLPATMRATSTSSRSCGPLTGWVRGYVVQPGDTLYRIATMHGVSVDTLKRANCKFSNLIYAGELLWVPYMLPAATELTIIPTFPSPTEPATPTATQPPTATETQSQTP
jgi:hypothetical protein